MPTILVVDDDEQVRRVLGRTLEQAGYNVIRAVNGREALLVVGDRAVDLVLTDILMPEVEGLETISGLLSVRPDTPVIAMSGGGRIDGKLCLDLARSLGARATLNKPIRRAQLLSAVEEALGA